MAKDVFIYSTLSASQKYTRYKEGPGGLPIAVGHVFVVGGANVADKRLITPKGTVTRVTAEQFEQLKEDQVFQIHVENGYITHSTAKEDADVVAADLTAKDESAPLTPSDYAPGAAPVVAEVEADPAPQPTVAPAAAPAPAAAAAPSRRA